MKKHLIIRVINNETILCSSEPEFKNGGIFVKEAVAIANDTGKTLEVEDLFISNDKVLYFFSREVKEGE